VKDPRTMNRTALIHEVSELRHLNSSMFKRLCEFECTLQRMKEAHEWASNELSDPGATWKSLAIGLISRSTKALREHRGQ